MKIEMSFKTYDEVLQNMGVEIEKKIAAFVVDDEVER